MVTFNLWILRLKISLLTFSIIFTVNLFCNNLFAQQIIKQELRPGTSHKLLILEPSNQPKNAVILFAGGNGMVGFQKDGKITRMRGNFLVRSRQLFLQNGFIVGIYSMPSDADDPDFRLSNEHAADIGKLIQEIKLKYKVKVWLVGHSRGSLSAANAGIKLAGEQKPAGLIFAAAVVETGNRGQPKVTDLKLEKIKIPSLVIHHRDDSCYVTLYDDAKFFFKNLKNSRRKDLITMEGGDPGWEIHACKSKSHHGFLDIEDDTVKKISNWIKSIN